MKKILKSCFLGIAIATIVAAVFVSPVLAMPPSPELVAQWRAEGILEQKLAWLDSIKPAGVDVPSTHGAWGRDRYAAAAALNVNAIDTVKALIILVDFSDKPCSSPTGGIAYALDSVLLSDKTKAGPKNPTGSMIDYYREVSYGKLLIQGHIYGPYRASQLYSYYVGTDNGFSRSPGLVREALTLGQSEIPFGNFVDPGTSFVPNVVVIHAGTGAEIGGGGIWSHMSSIGGFSLGGYSFGDYNMDPELYTGGVLSPIGVFCHEFGHILGLPDLYDTRSDPGNSEGIGEWSLMASGGYLGDSRTPAHLDPWCKIAMGFIPKDSIRVVSANRFHAAIPAAEYNQVVYKVPDSVWTLPGAPTVQYFSSQYFLVENRQKYGSDVNLRGKGLLIYHIDESVSSNTNPARYHVAVEQADGLNSLAYGGSRGDGGDPWPGETNNREFSNFSVPNSRLNVTGTVTQVATWNISNSDSIMYANLDYNYSHPYLTLAGADSIQLLDTTAGDNHDSVIDGGETVTFYCKVNNTMRQAYNWSVTLSCNDTEVVFLKNNVAQGATNLLTPAAGTKKSDSAVIFQLPPGAKGKFATFTVTVTADSVYQSGDRAYSKSWQFTRMLGTPNILLVDDDNGQSNEVEYKSILERLDSPHRVWNKLGGSPTATNLSGYKSVFWIQGAPPTGSFSAADVSALKTYLDNGGNLAITGTNAAPQLQTLDSAFLHNYLHAQTADLVDASGLFFFSQSGNEMSDSSAFKFGGYTPEPAYTFLNLTPINGGEPAYWSSFRKNGNPNQGNCGVTFNGPYKTVLLTFPVEYLSYTDTLDGFEVPDTLVSRIAEFFASSGSSEPHVSTLSILSNQADHVTVTLPTLTWHVIHPYGYTPSQAEIAVGTDSDWTTAELWNPAVFSTSASQMVYGGTPLTPGSTFYVRLRVSDGSTWTPWLQRTFRMNSVPSVPTAKSPTGDEFTGPTPVLWTTNSTDAESDPLFYDFQGFHDTDCVGGAGISLTHVASGTDSTGGQITTALKENCRYWWQVRAFDGYQYSAWSPLSNFQINGASDPPSIVTLLTPASSPVFTMLPSLTWTPATDPDPGDTVRYKVELALNSGFTSPLTKDSLLVDSFTVQDSLLFGTHYWWRVSAKDKTGLTTMCLSPGDFWTWQLGDLNGSHLCDLADLSSMVSYLTGGGYVINPKLVGDLNASCLVDLADLSTMVSYLTGGGAHFKPGCQTAPQNAVVSGRVVNENVKSGAVNVKPDVLEAGPKSPLR